MTEKPVVDARNESSRGIFSMAALLGLIYPNHSVEVCASTARLRIADLNNWLTSSSTRQDL